MEDSGYEAAATSNNESASGNVNGTEHGELEHLSISHKHLSNDSSTSGAPPSKRTRLDVVDVFEGKSEIPLSSAEQKRRPKSASLLQLLPLELLAEILMFTHSPKDVLAVTRTSKALFTTLTSPNTDFVWRAVRRDAVVPIPNPIGIFSEVTYASFLFDGGKCEVCQRYIDLPYTSFALRLRLCQRSSCIQTFASKGLWAPETMDADQVILQWTPTLEAERCIDARSSPSNVWPQCHAASRVNVSQKARLEYRDKSLNPGYLKGKEVAVKRNRTWMEFCVKLHLWKHKRIAQQIAIKNGNDKLAENFSKRNGYIHRDMMDCTGYGDWHRHRCKNLETINVTDLNVWAERIETGLIALAEKRCRRATVSAHQKNRKDVDLHWNKLRSSSKYSGLPSLSTFRTLPVVSLLLQDSSTTCVQKALSSEARLKHVLDEQLKKWTEGATKALDKLFGFEDWKSANPKMLHPCQRFTSRYQCKLCRALPDKYSVDGCLDFDGVCAHECSKPKTLSPKLRWRAPDWNADNFEIDQQASKAAQIYLETISINDKKAVSLPVNVWIVCHSCKPVAVLQVRSVIGHSHRHASGEFSIGVVSQTEIAQLFGGHLPLEFGTARRLLQSSYWARREREEKKYGCQICSSVGMEQAAKIQDDGEHTQQQQEEAANSAANAKESQKKVHNKKSTLFIWNGLRSHLKEKHKISNIRDEDFYIAARPL